MNPLRDTPTPPLATSSTKGRLQFAALVSWALVALLTVSNGLTLLSDTVHSAAYGLVSSVVQVAGEEVARRVLSRSPTNARTKEVDIATQRLKARAIALENSQRVLQADQLKLQQSRASLQKEHDSLRDTTTKRAAAAKSIATRTTAKLAARSARAIATLPARAVPYVGIAALVGFTGWEITMDCDIAQELNELSITHGDGPLDVGSVCKYVNQVPTAGQIWTEVKARASSTLGPVLDAIEGFKSR